MRLPIIYIAGAISGETLTFLRNIREGNKLAERVLATGKAAPFNPFQDWMYEMFGDHEVQTYYNFSLAFLRISDIMIIRREGAKRSKGTMAEIDEARRLGIIYFYDDQWDEFLIALDKAYQFQNTRLKSGAEVLDD